MPKSKHSNSSETQISTEDSELFRRSVDNSRVFDKDKLHTPTRDKKHPKFLNYSIVHTAEFSANEPLFWHAGASKSTLQVIQKGKIPLSGSIDLHGCTLEEACIELAHFIYTHQHEDYLHIIHGKGYNSNMLSPLKTQTFYYLKSHPQVQVICSTPEHLGGTGAVIIKLKNV